MRLDQAHFTHPGGHRINQDATRVLADDGLLRAVVCDGLASLNKTTGEESAVDESEMNEGAVDEGAADEGAAAANFCAETIMNASMSPLSHALLHTHQEMRTLQTTQATQAGRTRVRSTAALCVLDLDSGILKWATVGDSRVYVFRGGVLAEASPDDSAGYAAFMRGEVDREGIRLFEGRGPLTACLGDECEPVPHEGMVQLAPGDAVLVCSDGFWEYVYDFEMQVDLLKALSADTWLRLMLLRLVQRSYLAGDSSTALAWRVLA
jgi:serine/threonine protein phosphatase PrpC